MQGIVKTFSHLEFDARSLAARRKGRKVSVCLPARDEAKTVGRIVSTVYEHLTEAGGGADLVDEIVVVDDGSSDRTAELARRAGARVVSSGTPGGGKGEAMLVGVDESEGDVIVFLDADVVNFAEHFVVGLLGPMFDDDHVCLVKAFYERPLDGNPTGGGRVTELTARPALELLFPGLLQVRQPLSGESATSREVLEKLGLDPGYGAELGLLIDVACRYGTGSIAQVDLGSRTHRNRALLELRHQATDVLHAALDRIHLSAQLLP